MIHSCHLLPDCSLHLAGLKGSPPLTPAAVQAFLPEALAGKMSFVNIPFTQDFLHTPRMIAVACFSASRAAKYLSPQGLRAAVLNGLHCLAVAGEHVVVVFPAISVSELAKDIGQF